MDGGDDIFKTALPLFEEILDRICAFYSNFARNIHAIDELRIPHLTIFGSIECPNTAEYAIWAAYLSPLNMVIGVSQKISCKMQFSRVDFKSIGPSSQKL